MAGGESPRFGSSLDELISINEAARRGIERVRKPVWANPYDHIKIDIFDGKPGPWLHLWCPFNGECNGNDPIDILIVDPFVGNLDVAAVVAYDGPLPDSAEYRAEVERFKGSMG